MSKKIDILNDKSLWNEFNEDSIKEFMKFENKGRKILFKCDFPYQEWFTGYCINNYLYHDNGNNYQDLIRFSCITGWQWPNKIWEVFYDDKECTILNEKTKKHAIEAGVKVWAS